MKWYLVIDGLLVTGVSLIFAFFAFALRDTLIPAPLGIFTAFSTGYLIRIVNNKISNKREDIVICERYSNLKLTNWGKRDEHES